LFGKENPPGTTAFTECGLLRCCHGFVSHAPVRTVIPYLSRGRQTAKPPLPGTQLPFSSPRPFLAVLSSNDDVSAPAPKTIYAFGIEKHSLMVSTGFFLCLISFLPTPKCRVPSMLIFEIALFSFFKGLRLVTVGLDFRLVLSFLSPPLEWIIKIKLVGNLPLSSFLSSYLLAIDGLFPNVLFSVKGFPFSRLTTELMLVRRSSFIAFFLSMVFFFSHNSILSRCC